MNIRSMRGAFKTCPDRLSLRRGGGGIRKLHTGWSVLEIYLLQELDVGRGGFR